MEQLSSSSLSLIARRANRLGGRLTPDGRPRIRFWTCRSPGQIEKNVNWAKLVATASDRRSVGIVPRRRPLEQAWLGRDGLTPSRRRESGPVRSNGPPSFTSFGHKSGPLREAVHLTGRLRGRRGNAGESVGA